MPLFIYPASAAPVANGVASAGTSQLFARSDHVHSGLNESRLLWSLAGANMNTTADQALTQAFSFTNHLIDSIQILNASLSLSLAVGGFYTAASKGGVAIVANTQIYSSLSTNVKVLSATIASTDLRVNTVMYLALTTAQGGAATADIYVYGKALS